MARPTILIVIAIVVFITGFENEAFVSFCCFGNNTSVLEQMQNNYSKLFWMVLVLFTVTAQGQLQEPRPIVFAFDVQITLSYRAAARLKMRHESIVVSADYSGEPKKDAMGHANEIGMINLGVENVEVVGAEGLVKVTGTKIDLKRLDWIKGPVMLNVNLFSGRHASADNILACDFFDGKLSSAVRKTPELHCSLIEEQEKTRHRD